MVSISIVYPTCSRAGLTPKSEAKTTHPTLRGGSERRVGSLTARLNREICILMGQSYIVLFTLPFSPTVRIQLLSPPGPYGAPAREPPPLQPPRTAPASDLTSFRRRHYRARLPSCSFLKLGQTLRRISLLFAKD